LYVITYSLVGKFIVSHFTLIGKPWY